MAKIIEMVTNVSHELQKPLLDGSGLALKHISIDRGIIDNDYRGKISVIMHNNSLSPVLIPKSSNIAFSQPVISQSSHPLTPSHQQPLKEKGCPSSCPPIHALTTIQQTSQTKTQTGPILNNHHRTHHLHNLSN